MKDKSLILLSGGLDSAVSLAMNKYVDNIQLALFFNYGQKSFEREKSAVCNLCKYYGIDLKIIDLNWLNEITNNSLTDDNTDVPELCKDDLSDRDLTFKSMKSVWVPNRNGLFLNQDVVDSKQWTIEEIKNRTNKIVEILMKDYAL